MTVRAKNTKTEKFDIRLSREEEAVIKKAASLQHTSPTNFIRQQALVAAEAAVHDQASFIVSDKQWRAIEEALSQAARVFPNLQKRLSQVDQCDQ